jgi:hypothetical protein
MDKNKTRRIILAPIALSLGLIGIAALAFLVLFVSVSVSGSASLPNGTIAKITGPFACSNNSGTTVIDAGGHVFEFSPASISVDKTVIAPLDSSVTKVEIDASYWTASLRINDRDVPIVR